MTETKYTYSINGREATAGMFVEECIKYIDKLKMEKEYDEQLISELRRENAYLRRLMR